MDWSFVVLHWLDLHVDKYLRCWLKFYLKSPINGSIMQNILASILLPAYSHIINCGYASIYLPPYSHMINCAKSTNWSLSARLWYLWSISRGDITVLHMDMKIMIFTCLHMHPKLPTYMSSRVYTEIYMGHCLGTSIFWTVGSTSYNFKCTSWVSLSHGGAGFLLRFNSTM